MADAIWPWLALAGLGAFHGLNPAMGWLFAVALGMHRRSRRVVLLSLIPLALGHALSILLVAGSVVLLGLVLDMDLIRRLAGRKCLADPRPQRVDIRRMIRVRRHESQRRHESARL